MLRVAREERKKRTASGNAGPASASSQQPMTIQGIRRQREAEKQKHKHKPQGDNPPPQHSPGSPPAHPSSALEVLCPRGRSAVNLVVTWSIDEAAGTCRSLRTRTCAVSENV